MRNCCEAESKLFVVCCGCGVRGRYAEIRFISVTPKKTFASCKSGEKIALPIIESLMRAKPSPSSRGVGVEPRPRAAEYRDAAALLVLGGAFGRRCGPPRTPAQQPAAQHLTLHPQPHSLVLSLPADAHGRLDVPTGELEPLERYAIVPRGSVALREAKQLREESEAMEAKEARSARVRRGLKEQQSLHEQHALREEEGR